MGGVSACEDDATAVETRAICDAVVCEYIGVLVGGCVPLRVCLLASCAAAARHVDPQAKVMVLRRREERREGMEVRGGVVARRCPHFPWMQLTPRLYGSLAAQCLTALRSHEARAGGRRAGGRPRM
jgi:hypothetical protein